MYFALMSTARAAQLKAPTSKRKPTQRDSSGLFKETRSGARGRAVKERARKRDRQSERQRQRI